MINIEDVLEELRNPELSPGAVLALHAERFGASDFPAGVQDGVDDALRSLRRDGLSALEQLDYVRLPALVAQLWDRHRALQIPPRMTGVGQLNELPNRQSVYRRAQQESGWIVPEVDAVLVVANNQRNAIGQFTWSSVEINGRKFDRAALRNNLRTAAFSDEGWQRHLERDFPKIEAPRV